ncbi:hypothetical protein Arub01_45310 [Actinomadura rubrobrunea]|uniref:Uncharacterized protein n=1 Tax=Actinomadura rubrobrunea TaxID=115335 RepID=A0A9W6UYI7_9ACTN|nr:hypothetical protein Arub01_45310 [Actinomadura rubrobrunea]
MRRRNRCALHMDTGTGVPIATPTPCSDATCNAAKNGRPWKRDRDCPAGAGPVGRDEGRGGNTQRHRCMSA